MMIKAQTSDMMICRSEGGMPCSAWKLAAEVVNCQAEHARLEILPQNHHV